MVDVQKSAASNLCYKEAKDQLLEQYGPKEGYNFRLAMGLMLVTTPSALARKIVDLICTHKRKPLEQCCCKETVSGIWTAKLPENVRTAIANESLGGGIYQRCYRLLMKSTERPQQQAQWPQQP